MLATHRISSRLVSTPAKRADPLDSTPQLLAFSLYSLVLASLGSRTRSVCELKRSSCELRAPSAKVRGIQVAEAASFRQAKRKPPRVNSLAVERRGRRWGPRTSASHHNRVGLARNSKTADRQTDGQTNKHNWMPFTRAAANIA